MKGKRLRSLENQPLFDSPDINQTKRSKQSSVPPTPSTSDSRRSLLFEASASSKSLDSKEQNSRNLGRRRSLSSKEGGNSRSQSRLFQNEATESTIETATLLPSSQETREVSSRLFQSPERPSRQSNAAERSSFFGAVMSNVYHWKSGQPSTPQTSDIQNIAAASPGGFNLMNFVNSVSSPFQPKRNSKGNAPSTPMNPPTPSTPRYGSTTPRHEREWHQTTLSLSGEVKWIDWTLKSKLVFECSPGHSLHPCNAITQQKARMQFIAPTKQPSTNQPMNPQQAIEKASIQWQEGLLYWQYPAAIQDHASFPQEASQVRKGFNSLTQNIKGLARSSSMPSSVFTKAAKKSTPGTGLLNSLQPYEKEWQDAFASLYTSWIERVKLQCEKREIIENDAFAEEIAATYFYAQRKEHTVLFKVGISDESTKVGKRVELIPEIVISSTTQDQREKLRSLGVTLKVLERYTKRNNQFEEKLTEEPTAKEKNNEKESVSSAVDEDLVALRRAQVFGQTAGADVSISTTSRRFSKLSAIPKLISPLFLSGFEDCERFYLLYLNTTGKLCSDEIEKKDPKVKSNKNLFSPHVPLLFCRKLGPFLNASLKRLDVHYSNFESESASPDHYDAAEVCGIILPCAVRSLINAAIHSVECTTTQPILSETSKDSSESIVGANHLIVQLSLQEQSDDRSGQKKGGLSCSSFFNTNSSVWDSISDNESYEVCHFGESVETAVWDVNRSRDVAYKLSKLNAWDFK